MHCVLFAGLSAKSHLTFLVLYDFFRFITSVCYSISYTALMRCGIPPCLYLQYRGKVSRGKRKQKAWNQHCFISLHKCYLKSLVNVLLPLYWGTFGIFSITLYFLAFFYLILFIPRVGRRLLVRKGKLTCLRSRLGFWCSKTLKCDHHCGRNC